MTTTFQPAFVDYAILALYFAFILGIGVALKRYTRSSTDFLLSGRSIPGMGSWAGVPLRQPRRSGGNRHGRVGSGDAIRLAEVERLQLSLRQETGLRVGPAIYGVEIESVMMVFR
jgi:hypothetical protein